MALMEQIRLEATKYADDCKAQTNANWWEVGNAFQAGAQALLNLLGRSATSEGHPPRVWIVVDPKDKRIIGGWQSWVSYYGVPEEYLSFLEHEALRAAELLEIERQESQLKTWEGRCDKLTAALVDLKGIWMRRHGTEEMCRSRDPQGEFSLICMYLSEAKK